MTLFHWGFFVFLAVVLAAVLFSRRERSPKDTVPTFA